MEPLRRAAVHERQYPHRTVGPLWPPGPVAQIFGAGISHGVVVGRREGGQGRKSSLMIVFGLTRRDALVLGGAGLAAALATPAPAQESEERHGISAFGDLKYPASFKHFDYVDPEAPKGGTFSHVGSTSAFNQNFLTFNSLNTFILKGDAAQGMELTFASLMVRAEDEPDALYGLAARAVAISPDGLTYRFLLRPGLKFHDGSAL